MNELFNVNVNVILSENEDNKDIDVLVSRKDEVYDFELKNNSERDIRLKEVVLGSMELSARSNFYAEGYNMLSMYGGTLSNPVCIGSYSDDSHYKMPQTAGKFTVYNLLQINEQAGFLLAAFTSCNRFRGEFRIESANVETVMCLENYLLKSGDSVKLEQFFVGKDSSLDNVYSRFNVCVQKNHPKPDVKKPPLGWCSWYCYGADITVNDIRKNIKSIKEKLPQLEYMLIDDGYQRHMGDWLCDSDKFAISMKELCREIIASNMKPAIWVAPFIADGESEVFRNHPDWFVKDENGAPLCSSDVSFGGWRLSPWYMLDPTHPDAAVYIKKVFKTMKEEYGCNYFKLDANMWGALPFGKRYKDCTCIEAYRIGMEIICEAVGEDGFILGCNAPLWPSLGLVHGMRVSTDISRNWESVKQVAFECFRRSYQNGIFWMNDPDCAIYENLHLKLFDPASADKETGVQLFDEEKIFHLSAVAAGVGVKFLSDRICDSDETAISKFNKLLYADISDVKFLNEDFTVAKGKTSDNKTVVMFFNPYNNGILRDAKVEANKQLCELWTDEVVISRNVLTVSLPAHSARVYISK